MNKTDDEGFIESRRGFLQERMVQREADLEEFKQNYKQAREAGENEHASYYLDEIDRIEAEQDADAMKLARLNPQPQLDPADAAQLEKYGADLHRPHWAFDSKFIPVNERPTNGQVLGFAWQQAKMQGINTQDAVDVVAGEATGLPSPDELIREYNANAKHQLDAKVYNRGVRELMKAKSRGDYKDQ